MWGTPAWASCGAFFGRDVGATSAQLASDTSRVVLMRHGDLTVQSMQLNYQGPPEDFALVIPVPVVLKREQVRTLPHDVFWRLERLSAPRLVERWELPPCGPRRTDRKRVTVKSSTRATSSRSTRGVKQVGVFAVGEYDVVILSAKESSGLEAWLKQNKYAIPKGAAKLLKPYVQQGMYFFVAKVNASKLKRDAKGGYTLSPLRFHYRSDQLMLPVRLGQLNAHGRSQDLVIQLLAQSQRYEVANAKNVTAPTNVRVRVHPSPEQVGLLHRAMLDRIFSEQPGVVVTEHAWDITERRMMRQPRWADPEGAIITRRDLLTLGADQIKDDHQEGTHVSMHIPPPKVLAGKVSVDDLRERLWAIQGRLRYCRDYTSPRSGGEYRAVVTVGASGEVTRAKTTRATGGVRAYEGCVLKHLKRLKLPAHRVKTRRFAVSISFAAPELGRGIANLSAAHGKTQRARPTWTFTRLRLRLDPASPRDDLVFKKAHPIVSDRDLSPTRSPSSSPSAYNAFQTRYIALHRWIGPLACKKPRRGVWDQWRPSLRVRTTAYAAPPKALKPDDVAPALRSLVAQPRVPGIRALTAKREGSR